VLHANTQIPKIIGVAREYELTGDPRYHDIATFFWERVAKYRSYANGGHSDGESFFPIEQFSHHLSGDTSETCNTYNMLKLSRHLFEWAPSAEVMDFYEKGLYNHILASQDPATGMMIYYCPLKPGAYESFSTPDHSFWCCVGTGMENHAKYPDTIYFHDRENKTRYVNLFIPSALTWKDTGVSVTQATTFPDEDTTRLTFTTTKPTRLAVKVRYSLVGDVGLCDRGERQAGTHRQRHAAWLLRNRRSRVEEWLRNADDAAHEPATRSHAGQSARRRGALRPDPARRRSR
jgi:DUF1680 family protein